MEVSGLRDADVWAPLTGEEGFDSEEEEMGGSSVFRDHDYVGVGVGGGRGVSVNGAAKTGVSAAVR